MEKDTKKLFQITEAAHACGLSRSTLMRMEKKGLLTPAYIAAESGRRYYDNHDVARILQIEKFKRLENKKLSADFDYDEIEGLRIEARQKLNQFRPLSIGQASRISGVSPADINVLLIYMEKLRRKSRK